MKNSDRPFRGQRIEKPWGYELIWAHAEHYVGKILHIERGEALSLQYHREKDETLYVLSGSLDLQVGDSEAALESLQLQMGDSIRLRPGRRHRLIARETCEVLEASTAQIDDVVRLDDLYGRVEKKES